MNIYSYFLAVCNFIDTVPEINFQTVPTTAGGGPYLFLIFFFSFLGGLGGKWRWCSEFHMVCAAVIANK